jgi:hypothetical protein
MTLQLDRDEKCSTKRLSNFLMVTQLSSKLGLKFKYTNYKISTLVTPLLYYL